MARPERTAKVLGERARDPKFIVTVSGKGYCFVAPVKELSEAAAAEAARVWRDAAGNVLQDGDTVTVIKDLKLKGGGGVVKQGTKVKNIRLVDGDHDIDCKIDGFGAMSLKSEFVRKS